MRNTRISAILYAILAAVFYAINIPCSKLLLNVVSPTFMAAFLYLGAGVGVGIMYLFRYGQEEKNQLLAKEDLPYTVAMVVLDIAAPILLMSGVRAGMAANASLLGNFEIVATTLVALLLFKEKVSWRLWIAVALVTCSSIMLSFSGAGSLRFSMGSVLVIGATLCWGIENNCTRSISGKSTYQIVIIKGLCSGAGAFVIALILGEDIPTLKSIVIVLALGYVAYGLSIFTYIRAQKTLGAAKTSAYYASAPFIGVLLSAVFLKEHLTSSFMTALVVMLAGTALIVYESLVYNHMHVHRHYITHTHDGNTHTHVIVHSHSHNHMLNENNHAHTHDIKELERYL